MDTAPATPASGSTAPAASSPAPRRRSAAVQEAEALPLRYRTPDEWADSAFADPLALLDDHAHLERKAASNALELLSRWPGEEAPEGWAHVMVSVARDETEHLALVEKLIRVRGGRMSKNHRCPYAAELRTLVRRGEGKREVVDRLLVSALIEARSCERFSILARRIPDAKLARIFGALWASEVGHYRVFLKMARRMLPRKEVDARWSEMLDAEAAIIARQPPGPRVHSGV